jgi:hypothetical protein
VVGFCVLIRTSSYSLDWLSVSQASKPLIAQLVEPSMNPVFNKEHKAFIWNYYEGTSVYSWLLEFQDKERMEQFKETFGRCIFEALNQMPFSRFEVSIHRRGVSIASCSFIHLI